MSEEVHPGAEHQGSESVDQPDEANHPDGRVSGSAVRTVEIAQRDRCGEWDIVRSPKLFSMCF